MKKLLLLPIVLFLLFDYTNACTTFFLEKNGQRVFGRNYDWITGNGMVNTNLRGLSKSSLTIDGSNTIRWVAKYGSITFNQYGKEFPNGGMNEKGLVVELMWLNGTKYPDPDKRPGLSVLQWIQYQLDNFTSVEEVIGSDKNIRIYSAGTPIHFLAADVNGQVATIEYLNGKLVVHKGTDLPYPVLTNNTYQYALQAVKPALDNGSPLTFGDNSIERFAQACSMVQQFKKTEIKKPLVEYSFDVLNKVAQGSFTKWSIVYDMTNKKIYFKTYGYEQVKSLSAAAFDFACTAKPMAFNMNQDASGDVSKRFVDYSNTKNSEVLRESFQSSSDMIHIDGTLQQAIAETATKVKCG